MRRETKEKLIKTLEASLRELKGENRCHCHSCDHDDEEEEEQQEEEQEEDDLQMLTDFSDDLELILDAKEEMEEFNSFLFVENECGAISKNLQNLGGELQDILGNAENASLATVSEIFDDLNGVAAELTEELENLKEELEGMEEEKTKVFEKEFPNIAELLEKLSAIVEEYS